MLKYLAGLAIGALSLWPAVVSAAPAWEQWHPIKGVFDLGGPRTDGNLLVAGSAALYLLGQDGTEVAFARGPGGYHEDAGAEAYVATSPGAPGTSQGCAFTPDDTFILRLHVPIGITRVSAAGDETGSFGNLTGVSTLNGIAFDTTGAFDHRLLVTGVAGSHAVLFAVDCNGVGSVITRSAPTLEGGIAVAPSSFGAFAGQLIGADELSGNIYAIAASGKATAIAKPSLATGGDIGVESVGFVPPGFVTRGGFAYYADRATPGNAHPGTDYVLRVASSDLAAAGVEEGDMLVATEGGASLVDVRCTTSCSVATVIATPTKAHGEGHIVFTVAAPPAVASPVSRTTQTATMSPGLVDFIGAWGFPLGLVVIVLVFGAGIGVAALRRR